MVGRLAPREAEVLRLYRDRSLQDKEIAAEMGLSTRTVNTYWRRIFAATGTNRRQDAARATEAAA